jgi:hypothetical protein
MSIKEISEIFEKYGYKGGFFIITISILILLVKSKWFSNFFSKISDKFVERLIRNKVKDISVVSKSITDSDITNHDIFNYIDFWMYSKVPTLQFSTDYRTAVFRKYLTIYLKSYKKNISDFVLTKDYQNMDDAKVWKALLNLMNKTVFDYERECLEVGIPKIIIDKMKVKNNDNITLTFDLIEGVCGSRFYDSDKNLLKVYSILNILLSVLENTISNSESVCNSINGQLKGLKFIDGDKIYIEP